MKAIPLSISEANEFVKKYHRHNLSAIGCKFCIGALKNGNLIGVGIAGRPIARLLADKKTLEIIRVATDGTKNTNSFIYNRIRRIAQLMGYEKIITYTLKSESGASLRAIGAEIVAEVKPQSWNRKNRPRQEQPIYQQEKLRWEL